MVAQIEVFACIRLVDTAILTASGLSENRRSGPTRKGALDALECCLGTRPSQGAKSRPAENCLRPAPVGKPHRLALRRSVIAGYLFNFSNRRLPIPQGPEIRGNAALLSNVGRARSLGVEAGVQLQTVKAVTGTASYAYNQVTYRDDVVNAAGAVVQAIKSKAVVASPRHISNLKKLAARHRA